MTINLSGQDLRGRSFRGQDLSGADFSGADLRGADFSGAVLRDANFSHAKIGVRSPLLMSAMAVLLLIVVLISLPISSHARTHFLNTDMARYSSLALFLAGGSTPLIGALIGSKLLGWLKGTYPSKRNLSFWISLATFCLASLSLWWTISIVDLIAAQHEASGGAYAVLLSDFSSESYMVMNFAILLTGIGAVIGTTLAKCTKATLLSPATGVGMIAGLLLGSLTRLESVVIVNAYLSLIHLVGVPVLSAALGVGWGMLAIALSQRSWMWPLGWFLLFFFVGLIPRGLNADMAIMWGMVLMFWLMSWAIAIATQSTCFQGADLTDTTFT